MMIQPTKTKSTILSSFIFIPIIFLPLHQSDFRSDIFFAEQAQPLNWLSIFENYFLRALQLNISRFSFFPNNIDVEKNKIISIRYIDVCFYMKLNPIRRRREKNISQECHSKILSLHFLLLEKPFCGTILSSYYSCLTFVNTFFLCLKRR